LLSKEEGIVYSHIDRFVGHIANFDEVYRICTEYVRLRPQTTWSTATSMNWAEMGGVTGGKDKSHASAFAPQDKGFHVERGSTRVDLTSAKPFIFENMLTYQKFFAPNGLYLLFLLNLSECD